MKKLDKVSKMKKNLDKFEKIVKKLKAGWFLGYYNGEYSSVWIQKKGIGSLDKVENITEKTMVKLLDDGIIEKVSDINNLKTYEFSKVKKILGK